MRETKAQIEEQAEQFNRRATCVMVAVVALARGREADAEELVRLSDGTEYHLRLFNATDGHGGVVLIRFRCPGQKDSVTAQYLNRLSVESVPDKYQTMLVLAHRRLVAVRDGLLEKLVAEEDKLGREPAVGRD